MNNEPAAPTDGPTEFTRWHIRAAWAVHALTATGVIVGYVGLSSVLEGHARAGILWLVAALVLDGVDGPIARKLDVATRVPTLNGNTLDLIIDYLTCTIVPVAFMYQFDMMPSKTSGPIGFTILFVSVLWMSRTDQETPDGWFNGFPAEWNMIIPTLYLLHTSTWFNLVVCLVFCALTLSRVPFAHPVSVREQRPISLVFMLGWLGSMVWLAIAQHDVAAARVLLIVSPLWTVYQVVRRSAKRPRSVRRST